MSYTDKNGKTFKKGDTIKFPFILEFKVHEQLDDGRVYLEGITHGVRFLMMVPQDALQKDAELVEPHRS